MKRVIFCALVIISLLFGWHMVMSEETETDESLTKPQEVMRIFFSHKPLLETKYDFGFEIKKNLGATIPLPLSLNHLVLNTKPWQEAKTLYDQEFIKIKILDKKAFSMLRISVNPELLKPDKVPAANLPVADLIKIPSERLIGVKMTSEEGSRSVFLTNFEPPALIEGRDFKIVGNDSDKFDLILSCKAKDSRIIFSPTAAKELGISEKDKNNLFVSPWMSLCGKYPNVLITETELVVNPYDSSNIKGVFKMPENCLWLFITTEVGNYDNLVLKSKEIPLIIKAYFSGVTKIKIKR